MNCSKFEELLNDHIDGALASAQSSDFRAHTLQCRDCRALLDEVKAARQACKEEDDVEIPASLQSSLARIPAENSPLDCFRFEELITEFLDGFVPAPIYHRFEEHAADCKECSDVLTDVVYAVAACHSIHTYEDYEAPQSLIENLYQVMPARRGSFAKVFADRATSIFNLILPRATGGAAWSLATASVLVVVTATALLFGFSDDGTITGIYRQAQVKAAELYSEGSDLYSQKQEVVAEIEQVRSDIGELWDTLGGEKKSGSQQPTDSYSQKEATTTTGAGSK